MEMRYENIVECWGGQEKSLPKQWTRDPPTYMSDYAPVLSVGGTNTILRGTWNTFRLFPEQMWIKCNVKNSAPWDLE